MNDEPQKLTKMERLDMVVRYARSIGFFEAEKVFWQRGFEEIGSASPFEQPDPNEPTQHSIGICLNDEVTSLWWWPESPIMDENDSRKLVFDTKAECATFTSMHAGDQQTGMTQNERQSL